ncbi:MAG: RHS repeat-associated core domain-containing protein, partial [Nitrospinae bacterium]|nr:RHS repeat-associated core domain-containing protein [Nitrospinota bacterium]
GVTSASYNEANEMLTFVPATSSAKNMTYDENRNLKSMTNSCGTTTYTWDVRNRLSSISGFKPDCSSLTASFKYDALGRRIEKTINGVTTQYLYDGLDIIQEIQGSNKTNYIRTLNIDEPLARIKADGTIRHYKTDALGSVIALVDDAGAVKTTYTYDPFGNVTISGEASDNPFQYTGRENDNTGLYYYRARYYSPELQRFISEDPIGLDGGDINFFAYVWNSPQNWIDPYGLSNVATNAMRLGCIIIMIPVPGAQIVGGLIIGGATGYIVWKICKDNTEDRRDKNCPDDPLDDYPADPDAWNPPPGWKETPAGEKTGGRHREWRGPKGEWRRWDKEGRPSGKKRGPHWHDWRYPDRHIDPTK